MDSLMQMKTEATVLHAKFSERYDREPCVLRVTRNADVNQPDRHALLSTEKQANSVAFGATLSYQWNLSTSVPMRFTLPDAFGYLDEGDILRISPRSGDVWVMYRVNARTHSVFVTERCNSWCVMCSQPPKPRDSVNLADAWEQAIPFMDPLTPELGFTGGEPTLLGDRFIKLLTLARDCLPKAAIHVLSNGRLFAYLSFAEAVASVKHNDLIVGIPLYSDIGWRHDHVVQAPHSFDQTVRGILNLARVGVAVEIRVVLHRLTLERLLELAQFIARNFPFAAHVALMGYEPIGFGRTNLRSLWVDPVEYHEPLKRAVQWLVQQGIAVSIYNHQRCILPESLWPFAVKSISDWKNIYLPICEGCEARQDCGGFFHSAVDAHSAHIKPLQVHSLLS
ncbi:MAG: His-Xaa-Ser system radical SAM maturase HxsC [Pirellulaceae bacterium]|nr:His-Xaa-Ser system radical SAM maturase HxsC [Pirellulaceae bacterium]